MAKKLKIRFVKFEKTLAMQVLEQVGKFKETEHVKFGSPYFWSWCEVYLRGVDASSDLDVATLPTASNNERDEYLAKVVGWITDEQFTIAGELKVGEMCEVRTSFRANWMPRKLLAILPKSYRNRYIVCIPRCPCEWEPWECARPLAQRVEPKIDGDVYMWEM